MKVLLSMLHSSMRMSLWYYCVALTMGILLFLLLRKEQLGKRLSLSLLLPYLFLVLSSTVFKRKFRFSMLYRLELFRSYRMILERNQQNPLSDISGSAEYNDAISHRVSDACNYEKKTMDYSACRFPVQSSDESVAVAAQKRLFRCGRSVKQYFGSSTGIRLHRDVVYDYGKSNT